jgi:hypothetical protein
MRSVSQRCWAHPHGGVLHAIAPRAQTYVCARHCLTLWLCSAPSCLQRRLQPAAGRLLMARTSCRLPLGVPSQLVLTAMDLAGRLIGVPQSKAAAAQVLSSLLPSNIQTPRQRNKALKDRAGRPTTSNICNVCRYCECLLFS